jgi:ADP-heptose:LPS heptosyltransferase
MLIIQINNPQADIERTSQIGGRLKQLLGNRCCAPKRRSLLFYLKRPAKLARNVIREWVIPWRRSAHISCAAALGDALMCTPAMRALKQANPRCRIHFYTDYPDLVRDLWYLDEISPTKKRPRRAMQVSYEGELPTRCHLAKIIGKRLGVRVEDVRPDCSIDKKLVQQFRCAWRDLPRPHILVQRRAGSFTPNKDWPNQSWRTLISMILRTATVIDIGEHGEDAKCSATPNYMDLRGRTDLRELVACIAAADILVAPVSGPVHIASAVRTPAVVILGGYEQPENAAYSGNTILYTPIECSPCWLKTACPIDRECLRRISPQRVQEAIGDLWRRRFQPAEILPGACRD